MKKLILSSIFLLFAVGLFAQSTPGAIIRVATRSTTFGINVPIGYTVYCVADSSFWACKAATASTATLYSTNNFTQLNKPGGSGTVTSVTGTGPIVSSGGTTPAISITQASSTSNGYVSSTDWNTFNGKQAAFTDTLQVFEEASAGSSGSPHTLAGTPKVGSLEVTLNGMGLKASEYTIATNVLTVGKPVYQYDRVVIKFRY